LALVRMQEPFEREPVEALDFFFAAIAGRGSRTAALAWLAVTPFGAYWLAGAVRQLDWEFLLQKLGVIAVGAATLAGWPAAARRRRRRSDAALASVAAAVVAIAVGVPALSVEAAASGYAAVDPSFRLLRDARAARSPDTVVFYAYLRAHTLVSPSRIQAIDA